MKDVRIARTTYVFDDDDRKPLPRASAPLDDELLPSLDGFRRVDLRSLRADRIRAFADRKPKGGAR